MAAVKKPRGRVWENRETMLLLQKWGDENIQTKLLSCTRKKPTWQEISAFLRAAGYEDRDEDACKTRIHTLVSAYRSYKDECRKTGHGTPKKKPAFFDEVDEFLSGKPCTKPKSVVASSQIVIGDGTQVCEEESKRNVENVAPNLTSSSSSSSSTDNNNKASKCPEPKKDACVTCTGELSKKKKTIAYWRARQLSHVTEHGRLALSIKLMGLFLQIYFQDRWNHVLQEISKT